MHKKHNFLAGWFACLFLILIFLSGCAMQTEVNTAIASANSQRFAAFADGMIGCGDDTACKVGLSMAFAGGLGQQPLYREDSVSDILRAGVPYFDITDRIVGRLIKSSGVGDAAGLAIIGDNNTVSGVANKNTATEESSIAMTTEQQIARPSATTNGAGTTTLAPLVAAAPLAQASEQP